jgi:hypothetical protein
MKQDSRIIDGYAVLHSVWLDGFENIVAENAKPGNEGYRLIRGVRDSPLEAVRYTTDFENRDYAKVMREFIRTLSVRLDHVELGYIYRGSPMLTDMPADAECCVPYGMSDDIKGKLVVIRTDELMPEHRTFSHQLYLAADGRSCSPESGGHEVFCTNVYSGITTAFRRSGILGVVSEDAAWFPQWAREQLTRLRSRTEKEQTPQFESVIGKIEEGKRNKERRQTNAAENGKSERPPNKQRKQKGDPEL